jgi:hypothetical protein
LLDIEQMAMTLAFLTGYLPSIFGLAAVGGPEPHCTSCGGAVGIFLGHASDWPHFRTGGVGDGARVEVYDSGRLRRRVRNRSQSPRKIRA